VELRLAGAPLHAIASEVGLSGPSGAHYHVTEWIKRLQPSTEATEDCRQVQLARAEERYRRLQPLAMGKRDEETGEYVTDPDYRAIAAIQRDNERIARLLGADLERDVQVMVGDVAWHIGVDRCPSTR
jgi:hypothetical protein